MTRLGPVLAAALLAASSAAPGQGKNDGDRGNPSDTGLENRNYPLRIEIESGIDFSRSALRNKQDGDARIDPQTGEKIMGPNMIDLGGFPFQGQARVTGKPLRPVRIELPSSVTLRSSTGVKAELSEFKTDIDGVAMLDANGELVFRFGARISTIEASGGSFRGRIPIRVEYF